MNYIYDIILNFQDNYYQVFEWNKKDKIKTISKIVIYHVSNQDLLDLIYNNVIIDKPFLEGLKEENKKHKKIMCLISNGAQTIGLLISDDGTILKRSSLLFEEENEANNFAKTLPLTKITYKKNNKVLPKQHLRIETEKKDILVEYINKTNDILTLKYLYYEYFKKECEDESTIKSTLLKIIETE